MNRGQIYSVLSVAYEELAEDADLDMPLRTRFIIRDMAEDLRAKAIAAGEPVD